MSLATCSQSILEALVVQLRIYYPLALAALAAAGGPTLAAPVDGAYEIRDEVTPDMLRAARRPSVVLAFPSDEPVHWLTARSYHYIRGEVAIVAPGRSPTDGVRRARYYGRAMANALHEICQDYALLPEGVALIRVAGTPVDSLGEGDRWSQVCHVETEIQAVIQRAA